MAIKTTRNMAQVGREVLAMTVAETIAAARLSDREIERVAAEATALFAQLEARAAAWPVEMYGPAKRTAQEASIMAMREHCIYCAALGYLNECRVDASRYLGQTPAKIAEAVVASAAARRRGRGARAVARTYGDTAARNITDHSVRH